MKRFSFAVLLTALVAMPALAQVPVITNSSQPFVPLTGATDITSQFSSSDDSIVYITLPFAFPWFGSSYNSVGINTNGFVTFDASACSSGCYSNVAIPNSATPNNMIAPWWNDMSVSNGARVSYTSNASEVVIEYFQLNPFTTGTNVTFQMKLTASGTAYVHFGPKAGSAGSMSASSGLEGPGGALGATFLTCGTTCDVGSWVPDQLITIGEPPGPELAATSVTVSNIVELGDSNLTMDIQATLRNFGRMPANNFTYNFYLSTDRIKDASDQLLASGTTISIPATTSQNLTASGATTTAPAPGQYYVLLDIDPGNAVTEAVETNNTGSTTLPFIQGLDLVATSIVGVTSTGGGNVDSIRINFFNQGTRPAGLVSYRLLLSTDALLDANDFPIYTGTRMVTGGETVNETVSVTMPVNVPQGKFKYLLQIDNTMMLTEAIETNNVVASAAEVSVARADIVAESAQFLDPITNATTTVARFGESARVVARVSNQGGANANNFYVGVVLSTDSQLSLLSDQVIYEQLVAALPSAAAADAGASGQDVTMDFTIPSSQLADGGMPYGTGPYFVYVVADTRTAVYESKTTNNYLPVGPANPVTPIRISAPGGDLTVSSVQAPASAGVGEAVPVSRTIRNVGNVDAPEVKYRYVASANTIITADDLPLEIINNGSSAPTGTVTLARNSGSTASELVRLPATMPAGTYYIGCIVDSEDVVAELDELNNSLASNALQVAASSLKVNVVQLPDATNGRPYLYQLSASGEQDASMWSVVTAQGALPDGLTLSADGLLSGTPTGTTAQIASFTVVVNNTGRSAAARLVMRVLPPSSQLEITSDNIPAVINSPSTMFKFGFAAAGGVKPYTWKLALGTLPGGLSLTSEGVLSGSPRAGTADGATPITIRVTDSTGTSVSQPFYVRLVAPGSFVIRTNTLPDAILGAEYLQDIAVDNLDGSPLATPIYWTTSGVLPDGFTLQQETAVITLQGVAQRGGTYRFTITAEDAKGRTDSVDLVLRVYPPKLRVTADFSALMRPGQSVAVQLAVAPGSASVYRIAAGTLPPGLQLMSDGLVTGTVDELNSEGSWNFVIEAVGNAGITGLGAFSARVEREVKPKTCSSTGSGLAPIVGVVALLTLLRRSKRAALLAAVLAVTPAAFAQSYQVDGPRSISYTALPSTATSISPGSFSGVNVTLPFVFPFFGQPITSVGVSRYGYLAIGGSDSGDDANIAIPSAGSFSPTSFIAPWWDSLSTSSGPTFRWTTQGTAPYRMAVFEWGNVKVGSGTAFSFQAILFETTGQIRFAYGAASPSTGSASVGIQTSPTQGVAGTSCGAAGNCGTSGFPAGQSIDFYTPSDLRITSVSAEQVGYSGVALRTSAVLRNGGGRAASNVVTRFYLSTDSALDAADLVLGEGTSGTVALGQDTVVTGSTTIPASAMPGSYFILAKVDPDNQIAEQNETNNNGPAVSMTIGMPKGDAVVTAVTYPGTAQPGATLQVTRTIANAGNAAIDPFKYTYFLSDNSVVSIADRVLSPVGTIAGLAAGDNDTGTNMVTLPAGLPAGTYWLGVCANFDGSQMSAGFAVDEISVVNNCFSSTGSLVISSGSVMVTTTSLPTATQYSPYGLRLAAAGGSGQFTWELVGGTLPAGLALSSKGDLTGAPAVVGSFSFEVKVTSGTQTATKQLSMQVTSGQLALVIVDQDLPTAEFGRAFSASLVAVGGKPPYLWAVNADSSLPAGLALSSDGFIEGRAAEVKDSSFAVTVSDAAGATSSKTLTLRVVTPSTLAIATNGLPTAYIRREYVQALTAVGGRAPYTWSVTSFQKLPQNATEAPGAVENALPDWLGLTIEDTVDADVLRGTPKVAGLYSVTFKVVDTNGTEDQVAVELMVSYLDGFAITTTSLPDAFVNQNYAVKLSHNGGAESEGVVFSPACVQQAVRVDKFECLSVDATQLLPEGLSLGSAGEILGIPVREGTHTFLVKAVDSTGRQDFRSLSIRVKADYKQTESQGGCSGTGLDIFFGPLVALLGLGLRRRRFAHQ